MVQIQSAIIINVSVGTGYSDILIPYENKDGSFDQIGLSDYIIRLLTATIIRSYSPHHLMFPLFIKWAYLPSDWLYVRNVDRFRSEIQKIIDDRRLGKSKTTSESGDLLTILIGTDFYS
jgi:hypothetical protein